MIISITGRALAGKDLSGSIIQYLMWKRLVESGQIESTLMPLSFFIEGTPANNHLSGWKRVKFADKLKDILCILTGCTRAQLEDQEFKKQFLPEEWWHNEHNKLTYRDALQIIGTDLFRAGFHSNTWVNATMSDYKRELNWVITDMRFPNENDAVKRVGGITIKIIRDIEDDITINSSHASETSVDNIVADYTIRNNGSIDGLMEKLKDILISEKLL